MKIILVILHVVISLSSVVIYHLYWNTRFGQTSKCQADIYVKSRKYSSANSEPKTSIKNSSVWCWGSSFNNRICYFHNLYFHSNEFIFVNGKDSLYYGLPENQFDPALLDLSSVKDHNGQFFNYVDVLYENSGKLLGPARQVLDLTLSFQRFHPDNLMHAFHDDLIPLFNTLETFAPILQTKMEEVRLFFADHRSPGRYKNLYEVMSSKRPLYRSALRNETICFSRILLGLVKNTTWYQYGFLRPQGPLHHQIDARALRRFAGFVRRKLSPEVDPQAENLVVLLVRKENRLILNEVELAYGLVHDLGLKVRAMSEETHALTDVISAVSAARVVVGMHGSLLVLSLFLPPGSMLVEMFPYAVDPDNYTPYRTLAGVRGMNVSYAAWRNEDVESTLPHPGRPPHEGGIRHLPVERQREIESSSEVPTHLCCEDPHWLFRIYQDTRVDVAKVVELVAKDLRDPVFEPRSASAVEDLAASRNGRILPYRVTSIKCSLVEDSDEPMLSLSWNDPLNLDSFRREEFVYEVWLQESVTNRYLTFQSSSNSCNLSALDGIEGKTSYHVWIRGVAGGTSRGPFNNHRITCATSR